MIRRYSSQEPVRLKGGFTAVDYSYQEGGDSLNKR